MKSPGGKKRLLLVNPWIVDFTAYDLWIKPLGLLYLASIIKRFTGLELYFLDCLNRHHPDLAKFGFKYKERADGTGSLYWEEIEKPDFLKDIPRRLKRYGIPLEIFDAELKNIPTPDLILITSFMTYWYPGVQMVIERLKKLLGNIPVILGGIYPTLLKEHAVKESGADLVVDGEGEDKILGLLEETLSIKYEPPVLNSLDDYPYPSFELLNNRESLALLTSRGCPYRCSYCASFILQRSFRQRKPEEVIKELKYIKTKFNTSHIAFYDDALLFKKEEHIKPILKGIIEQRIKFNFHTPNGLSVGEIDLELANLMKLAGFKTLRLSLETTKRETIERTLSLHKAEGFEEAFNNLLKAGFRRNEIEVYLMVGLPDQEKEEVEESIRYVGGFGAISRLAYFSPIPGTIEWKRMEERGLISLKHDPMLHNKILFPYRWSKIDPQALKDLKDLSRRLNERNRGANPC